jgi:hypothetical protein
MVDVRIWRSKSARGFSLEYQDGYPSTRRKPIAGSTLERKTGGFLGPRWSGEKPTRGLVQDSHMLLHPSGQVLRQVTTEDS